MVERVLAAKDFLVAVSSGFSHSYHQGCLAVLKSVGRAKCSSPGLWGSAASSHSRGLPPSDVFAGSSVLSSGKRAHSLRLCLRSYSLLPGSPLSVRAPGGSPWSNDVTFFSSSSSPTRNTNRPCSTPTPSRSVDDCDPPGMREQVCRVWARRLSVHSTLTSNWPRPALRPQLMRKSAPFPVQDRSFDSTPLPFQGIEPCSVGYFHSIWCFQLVPLHCLEPTHMLGSLSSPWKCLPRPRVLSHYHALFLFPCEATLQ